jgi:hypothetical protein
MTIGTVEVVVVGRVVEVVVVGRVVEVVVVGRVVEVVVVGRVVEVVVATCPLQSWIKESLGSSIKNIAL